MSRVAHWMNDQRGSGIGSIERGRSGFGEWDLERVGGVGAGGSEWARGRAGTWDGERNGLGGEQIERGVAMRKFLSTPGKVKKVQQRRPTVERMLSALPPGQSSRREWI